MFSKILIANRGEIACRVIRTAQKLGVKTVSVYSEADKNAQHVLQADEAVYIGPAPSSESYLQVDKVIEAAKSTGAQAVHPGYGFLSENETFANALQASGITFIGPPESAIAAMGSKSAAKSIMEKADVPLVPGYHGEEQAESFLLGEAKKIGFPVLLKAAYGGGGKGMRIVNSEREFSEALASAKREATSSFSNDKMLVEKYIAQPRHVEIQVFCDGHGNAVYIAERDCSVQRRHQKVVEEAPAPRLSEDTRKAMGEAAVRAAQAINYEGAGTVEFLLDKDESFYFMEMNTRLQVEHPVTEMITGVDLVEWQLRVAAGEVLPLKQKDIQINGHAFEARIYAENAEQDFMPSSGVLNVLEFPEASESVRIDSGVIAGDEVTTFYDPMIAKLIVWDENRDAALRKLQNALRETHIVGPHTNTNYLHSIATHPVFVDAKASTHFIDDYQDDLKHSLETEVHSQLSWILASWVASQANEGSDVWEQLKGWHLNKRPQHRVELLIGENVETFLFSQNGKTLENKEHDIAITWHDATTATLNGHRSQYNVYATEDGYHLFSSQGELSALHYDPISALEHEEAEGTLTAPMNGTILEVLVKAGDNVQEGDALVIMEAMKMEYTIRASVDAQVDQVFFAAGDLVSDGAELVSLLPNEEG
ncbi:MULTISPECIES: acetyl/propionyl/methylcrotonyl-CoA carboxylase subunit alpha [Gammaproteobacteria]|uniref:acetyl/propionyl/methylcrotonyl-CoA carboxylase subunit alpha n=1 Tax=Gammaproteobacteria TaxID=1236 RepID=UPI000DCFDA01|nr:MULTISPECIES: acetyl/propionyl/methylcrotonyl-CoA carboxylase subunit alpha [Gammaproteobacteria]RTE87379.1 acetyl/propionyl/methylcrotonyl-CoA carboxylase subunit alpha [Aliidiomarina sp. B3213]TCZ92835.1 acetyl/propionyl/methylcrotonyl-CoA carboxylase subunit alpha [Lysobacter sp. N42]